MAVMEKERMWEKIEDGVYMVKIHYTKLSRSNKCVCGGERKNVEKAPRIKG